MKYYKENYPKLNDIVYGHVHKITISHVVVKLEEYNDIEGIILINDVTVRRKRKSYCKIKSGKKYPFVVKAISKDNKNIDLSFKYVTKEEKKDFMSKFSKYKKSMSSFKNFLTKIKQKYTDEYYYEMCEKTLWKIEKEKLYDYILNFYMKKNNMELFEISEEEKMIFREILQNSLGKLKFSTKYEFLIKNPNYGGVDDIKEIFSQIEEQFGVEVYIDSIPKYFVSIASENEEENEKFAKVLEDNIAQLAKKNKCLYKTEEITTTSNL